MTVRQQLNATQPIIEQDGTMSALFRAWAILVSNQLPLTGAGSPEGVVIAPQFSEYLDTTAAAGSIIYKKMLSDIGGDKSQGWKLG